MHKYDNSALKLVLYNRRWRLNIRIKMHKSKIDRPFAEGSRDLQRCQCLEFKIEIKIFLSEACFSCQRHDRKFSISPTRHIIGSSQAENKVYFLSTILSQYMASRIHGCLPYQHFPWNLLLSSY